MAKKTDRGKNLLLSLWWTSNRKSRALYLGKAYTTLTKSMLNSEAK